MKIKREKLDCCNFTFKCNNFKSVRVFVYSFLLDLNPDPVVVVYLSRVQELTMRLMD